jgi:uncharacterized protein (DUF433 family)
MKPLKRITLDPEAMGGKPCIRGLRVAIGTIVSLLASGRSMEDVRNAYPYLEGEDIYEALAYAAWRANEIEVPLAPA